jgi:hypothetical protein
MPWRNIAFVEQLHDVIRVEVSGEYRLRLTLSPKSLRGIQTGAAACSTGGVLSRRASCWSVRSGRGRRRCAGAAATRGHDVFVEPWAAAFGWDGAVALARRINSASTPEPETAR